MPAQADFALLFDHLPDPVAHSGQDLTVQACNRKFRERFPVLIESRSLRRCVRFWRTRAGQTTARSAFPIIRPARQSIWPGRNRTALEPRVSWLPKGGVLIVFRPVGSDEAVYQQQIRHLRVSRWRRRSNRPAMPGRKLRPIRNGCQSPATSCAHR